jgi:hypothetical protein
MSGDIVKRSIKKAIYLLPFTLGGLQQDKRIHVRFSLEVHVEIGRSVLLSFSKLHIRPVTTGIE